jgi:GNAT superfamily N-acetyltransferase
MDARGSGDIAYRAYRAGDEASIVALFNQVFHRSITVKDWAWAYGQNPIPGKEIVLAFSGPELVGQAASVPLRFIWNGEPIRVARPQNVMVHPGFRNRGIFTRLLEELTRSLSEHRTDLVVTFPNNNSLPAFIRKLDYTHVGDITTHVRPWDGVRDAVADDRNRCVISAVPAFTAADRGFMRSCLAPYGAFNARTSGYLTWRYGAGSGKTYHVLRAYRGHHPAGLIVCKLFRENQSVDLVEFFCREDVASVEPWLAALACYFRAQGIGISGFNIWLMPHYAPYRLLGEAGFRPSAFSTHLVSRSFSPGTETGSREPTSFYLAMGDSDVY